MNLCVQTRRRCRERDRRRCQTSRTSAATEEVEVCTEEEVVDEVLLQEEGLALLEEEVKKIARFSTNFCSFYSCSLLLRRLSADALGVFDLLPGYFHGFTTYNYGGAAAGGGGVGGGGGFSTGYSAGLGGGGGGAAIKPGEKRDY